jgi:twinfilin-like protein
MLYASTKATLKLEFGSARILEEILATEISEATYDGYQVSFTFSGEYGPCTSKSRAKFERAKAITNQC